MPRSDAPNRAVAIITAWRAGDERLAADLLRKDENPWRLLWAMTGLAIGAYETMDRLNPNIDVASYLSQVALKNEGYLNGLIPEEGPVSE